MEKLDFANITKSISIKPSESPTHSLTNSPKKKAKFIEDMDAIRENDDEPDKNEDDDSLLDESPPAEKELFTHNNLINQNIEYNYSLCYSEYPTIFDSLPSKVDDLEDESYLWEKQLDKESKPGVLQMIRAEDEVKEESEEVLIKKAKELDRQPNFFINGEGFRFARNSIFFFHEASFLRIYVLNHILYTKYFKGLLLFFLLLNLIAYGLYDYSYRLLEEVNSEEEINEAAFVIELICNIFFTIELMLRFFSIGTILERYSYLRTREGIVIFVMWILNWLFLIKMPENHQISSLLNTIMMLKACRIVRVLRILFVFKDLNLTVVSLINAIPYMARTFYCLLIVFIFYTIWGMHFFQGIEEYRCRETPEPEEINGTFVWRLADVEYHCGYWNCPDGTYCGSPYDYDMPFNNSELNSELFNFGITTFNNFFDSLLIVAHFVFLVGWSNFTYYYWRSAEGFFTALFFGSLVMIGFFIMVNLFLASVYDSFMLHTSIKDKSKHTPQKQLTEVDKPKGESPNFFLNLGNISKRENTNETKSKHGQRKERDMKVSTIPLRPKFTMAHNNKDDYLSAFKGRILTLFEQDWFRRIISILIIGDIIVLCLDSYPITRSNMILLHQLDFFFFCFFFVEISAKLFATGLSGIKNSIIFLVDVFIIYTNFIVIIYELSNSISLFEEGSKVGIGIKTLKMIRIFRVLYYTQLFSSLSIIIRALIKTLNKMKQFFFIMAVLVVVFALMGMQIFSHRARFGEVGTGIIYEPEGLPPRPNFDDFFNAVVSIMLILYNEEWHISMYQHAIAVGQVSIVFYIFVVFVAQILMMKLLVALFLNNFINYIKSEIIEEPHGDILQVLKLGFKRRLLTFANYINNQTTDNNNPQENNNHENEKTVSKFGLLKMALIKKILRYSQNIQQDEDSPAGEEHHENPLLSALKHVTQQSHRKSIIENQNNAALLLINPTSDATERRLLKKPIPATDQLLPKLAENVVGSPIPIKKKSIIRDFIVKTYTKALFLFKANSNLRKFLKKILSNWAFETFMLFVIFVSSLILVIENPFEDPNSDTQMLLTTLDQVVTIIYGVEVLMNAIAFGFILGPDTYLRRSRWNILDFSVFIFSLLGVILTKDQLKINSMKVFRTIRILKLGQKNPGIRVAIQALIAALPNILRLLAFSFVFILCFALYSMRYLKSLYYSCATIDKEFMDLYVKNKQDCFDYGGDWIRNDMHFDSILAAVSTLFQVATAEGWLLEMYKAVDATNYNEQPLRDFNKLWIVFYLIYFFVGNFLVMNMFIAVIGETYLDQKNKASRFNLLTEEQKEWALIKTSIFKMSPKKEKMRMRYKFQENIMRFRKWPPIKQFYNFCVALNIIILTLYYHRQPKEMSNILNEINMIMIYLFTVYFVIRMFCIVSLKKFIKSKNTIILLILLSLSYASYGINNSDRVLNALAKASQTILAYHILKNFNIVQRLFHTIFFVLPSLSNIVSLMLLILYIYTIVGMDIFAYLRPQKTVNGYDVDFKTFPKALFSLFRVMTAEMWFYIVNDCTRERAPNFACLDIKSYDDYVLYGLNGCGSSFYYFFFYTYHLFFSLIILNLFIVTILVSYGEVFNAEQRAIDRFQLSKIKHLWTHFDPLALGYINYKEFWTLASKIAVVFGVSEHDLLDVKNKKNFINILKIPLYENIKEKLFCYKFHDVIVRLAEISVTIKYGVVDLESPSVNKNDTDNNKFDENPNLIKKKKNSSKNSAFVKTSFHSGDMASIMIIYNKIRKWIKKAKKIDDEIVDMGGFHDYLKKQKEQKAEEKNKLEEEHKNNEERQENKEIINNEVNIKESPMPPMPISENQENI